MQCFWEDDDIISESSEGIEKTFDLISDIGISPARPSPNLENLEFKIDEEVKNPSLGKGNPNHLNSEKRKDFVSKCCPNGEWTKWVPERCTPEELTIFKETKLLVTEHFGKEIDDNTILRFLARRDFQNPEYSFKKLIEYSKYIEKYDYHNLTKEGIIRKAKGKGKHIFDWGVHNFVGFDKLGRPVVLIKVSNIDKGCMNEIDTARLYLLYMVKY